jgi:hypothetical protein
MSKVLSVLFGMVLTLAGMAAIGYALLGENIGIERVAEDHNRTVIVDGKVQSSQDWTEVLGYRISINLLDETYIGK